MREKAKVVGVRECKGIRTIPDAVIACMGAIDLDPCSKQKHCGIFIFLIVISTNHD
jgi:hypothetical protein